MNFGGLGTRLGTLGAGLGTGGGVVPPAGGSSPTRYSFAATRLRWPLAQRTAHATNRFYCSKFRFASPDYDVIDPRFFLPGFYTDTNDEFAVANTITVEGISILVGATWTAAPGSWPQTIDPALVPGLLTAAIPVTIPANTYVEGRVVYNVPTAGASSIPAVTPNTGAGHSEAVLGGTSSLAAKLTDGTSVGNSGGHSDIYCPAFMVAKGGDGRPVFILVGDSIGFGSNEVSPIAFRSARGEFGFLARGLDDNTTTKRLAYGHFCIPGNRPSDWSNRSEWARKLDAVKMVFDQEGAWPFDEVISEHGTNSVPTGTYASAGGLREAMEQYFDLMQSEWGKPITQTELLPKPTSTDGFATLANQSNDSNNIYPTGQRWLLNADIGGADGLGDPASHFRARGDIIGSFAPWRASAYDLAGNRDKLAIRPFSTTLASAYSSGNSLVTTASPPVGEIIVVNAAWAATVNSVTGSGPYTVSITPHGSTSAAPLAAAVQAAAHDFAGLHPSSVAHQTLYMPAVVAWKQSRGWV